MESRAAARLGASVAGCAAGLGLVVTLVVQTLGTLPDAVMGPGQVAPVRPTFQAVEPRMLGAQRVGETQVVVQLPLFTPVDQAAQFGDRYGLGLEDSFPAFGKYVFNLPQISVQPGTQPGTAVIYFPAQASLADIHDYLTSNRLTVRRWYHVNDGGGQTPAKAALVLLPRVRLELVNAARGIWRATLPAHLDLARLNEWAAGVGIRIIRYDAGTGVVLIKGPAVARPASVTRVVRRVISRPAIATPKPRTVSPPAGTAPGTNLSPSPSSDQPPVATVAEPPTPDPGINLSPSSSSDQPPAATVAEPATPDPSTVTSPAGSPDQTLTSANPSDPPVTSSSPAAPATASDSATAATAADGTPVANASPADGSTANASGGDPSGGGGGAAASTPAQPPAPPGPGTGSDSVPNTPTAASEPSTTTSVTDADPTVQADVSITKSGPATAVAGSQITYSITITNSGPDAAENVGLSDILSPGMTVISFTQDSGPALGGTLAMGEMMAFTIDVFVNGGNAPGTILTNSASVSSTTVDPNPGNNSSTATTTVVEVATDLVLTKAGPASANEGGSVNYMLRLTNGGPADAVNVVLLDTLPLGLSPTLFSQLSGPAASLSFDGVRTFIASFSCLLAGASAEFQVGTTVNTGTGGSTLTNTASVGSDTSDSVPANNTAVATTAIYGADLALTKAGPASANEGGSVYYELTLTNLGPADAVNVVLADTLPLGLTPSLFGQLSGPGASLAFDGIRTFTAAFGSLAAGAIAIFRVGATVNTGTGGGTLTNTAGVGSDTSDPDPANNTASASTPIEGADLVLTKAGPASANEGDSVYYELTLTNLGPADAVNVVLADTLPLGLTPSLFAQLSGPGASLAFDGIRTFTATFGSLASGAIAMFRVGATVNTGTGGSTLTNTAGVGSDTSDPVPANNSASIDITVSPAAPPALSAPDLLAADDSGVSSTDNLTNVTTPHFAVHGLPLLRIALLEAAVELGSAFADTLGDALIQVATALSDGLHPIYAQQFAADSTPSDPSESLTVRIDTAAPVAPLLDLPAAEDSGVSSSDNITKVDVWHFFAAPPTEQTVTAITELAPNGRLDTSSWPGDPTSACHCYYFPDTGGGLGADNRQGLWTYTASFTDLAGNASPLSNTLAISFDSIAPAAPVLDLPASEDSGFSSTDNVTNVASWNLVGSTPEAGTDRLLLHESAPNGRQLDGGPYLGSLGWSGLVAFPDSGGGLGPDGRQGLWTYTGFVRDLAGNQSDTSNTLAINFDSIAPVTVASITGNPGDNGWWKAGSPTILTLTATDDRSGVAATTFTVNGGATQVYSGPVTFPDGIYHVTFNSADIAGNTETAQAADFMVDQTQPVVTIGGVTDGATYFLNGAPTPTFTASDALSGIATQSATLTPPSTASGAGFYVYRVTVTDSAGNVTVATATYLVIYRFSGFLSPLTPGATYKQGRKLPVIFTLLDSAFAPVANANGTLYVDGARVGDFIYMGSGIYQFNLNTSSLSLGRHTLTAQLDDTTTHSIDIFIRS